MKSKIVQRVLRALITLLGGGVGITIALLIHRLLQYYSEEGYVLPPGSLLLLYGAGALLFGVIFFFISPWIIKRSTELGNNVERYLDTMPMHQVLSSTVGLISGLVIAALTTQLFTPLGNSVLIATLSAIVYVVFGSIGLSIGRKRSKEMAALSGEEGAAKERRFFKNFGSGSNKGVPPKVLDTSVIIDGRVFDLYKIGFLEGELVLPQFVLDELRHIADSGDLTRRTRGRRGLEVLARMQNELKLPARVDETDFDDVAEVDVKLLRLARNLGGTVVTNDYNLNKVAEVTGVKVLNMNELVNALKPVVLPGEEMRVLIVKEGKEPGQGVAYLDDGTMIVVDNAKRHVGEEMEVAVTTVLQTSAGRMIFARIANG